MRRIMMLVAAIAFVAIVNAQSYEMKNGKVVLKTQSTKTKTPDKVYQIIGKDTIFQGAKGGLYYWKMSKAGKRIKTYLKR